MTRAASRLSSYPGLVTCTVNVGVGAPRILDAMAATMLESIPPLT